MNYIRKNASNQIGDLVQLCESADEHKVGVIDISVFANIIKYNVQGVEDILLINFENEHIANAAQVEIDYQEFFKKYLLDNEGATTAEETADEVNEKVDINGILRRVAQASRSANINLTYALKFFDHGQSGLLSIKDLD